MKPISIAPTILAAGLLAAALGLPAAAAPAGAAADAAFDAFQKVCGDTHADYGQVAAASNVEGWRDSDVLAQTMPGVSITDKLARTKSLDGGQATLFATRGVTKAGFKVATCTVYADKDALATFKERAARWTGFAPHDSDAQTATWHFTNEGATLKPVADAEVEAAAGGSGMQMLTVKVENGKALLDYVKISK
ncbi:MAG: hypothetical protein ACREQ5_18570 [Candidatus Dormibacteria bacterium]